MDKTLPSCKLIPLPLGQVSFQRHGKESLRWNHHQSAHRPCFYPLNGPGGDSLVRMGHPGAPNHDHHTGVWFAHNSVSGVDFWSNSSPAHIVQSQWLVYDDGDAESTMACQLDWLDGHNPEPLLRQTLVACFQPRQREQYTLELSSQFQPMAGTIELGQTNFGFLAIRVATNISEFFGGGQITNSLGKIGEPMVFGKPSKWMDYSGPAGHRARDANSSTNIEGITCIDHPGNPGQPTRWHVREDGWMGPSVCRMASLVVTADRPLTLRYLLDIHSGPYRHERAQALADQFAESPGWIVKDSTAKHRQHEVTRVD